MAEDEDGTVPDGFKMVGLCVTALDCGNRLVADDNTVNECDDDNIDECGNDTVECVD